MAVPTTYFAINGEDATFDDLTVTTQTTTTQTITTLTSTTGNITTVNATTVDLNGSATGLILDADADTSITAPTDDQIDIEVAGADDFRITANTFTALSGSTIATNTIAETTAANGVIVDNLLIKDGGFVAAGAIDANGQEFILDADADTSITADTDDTIDIKIATADDFQFTANTFTALSGSVIATNTINETTADTGVTIDNARIKDGVIQAGQQDDVVAITGDGAITVAPSSVFLSKGSAAAITVVAPTATTHDGYILRVVAISAQAHVITSATVGFNAKGSSGTATFGGALGDSVTFIAKYWYIPKYKDCHYIGAVSPNKAYRDN